MRQYKFALSAFAVAATLVGCGGGGGGDQTPKIQFGSLVSFGDSLSDVGTYAVGTVKALGGGKFTINGTADSRNWVELLASQLQQTAPCAAQTGLDGDPTKGFSVPVKNNPGCTAYAQGGARVTNPVGPGNKLLGGANAILGQLTVPVVTQIQNYLATSGGTFKGNELVVILAGGNDVFAQLGSITAGAATPTAGVTAMGVAGAEMAAYVNNLILAKGAKYVVVVNLPDVSKTPLGIGAEAAQPGTQALINPMVTTFNSQLQGLAANPNVAFVDAYAVSRDQVANPAQYGLTNVTQPACDLSPAKNPLGSSLVCSPANLIPGVVDRYEFADSVHPTPYANQLLARYVSLELIKKGWL